MISFSKPMYDYLWEPIFSQSKLAANLSFLEKRSIMYQMLNPYFTDFLWMDVIIPRYPTYVDVIA